eukprot:TRINITY_DN11238_c0_g2_i1.p3 TRINITY_DN11238_c0_g2~~TRINITY_DN11238_c0_g2_i1.p3  ORF type:complete len:142 (-),score=0.94 TRINITY_DN11238_c0_g2_i1:2384-2809(-)
MLASGTVNVGNAGFSLAKHDCEQHCSVVTEHSLPDTVRLAYALFPPGHGRDDVGCSTKRLCSDGQQNIDSIRRTHCKSYLAVRFLKSVAALSSSNGVAISKRSWMPITQALLGSCVSTWQKARSKKARLSSFKSLLVPTQR